MKYFACPSLPDAAMSSWVSFWSEIWDGWETRDASLARAPVSAHSLTHGQAGNTRHIWAGCCPALSLVSWPQYRPLIGCWLACDRVFCSAYPGTGTSSSLHLVSLNPSPGADQATSGRDSRTGSVTSQSYSGLLTAVSALIVVTGLQTVIDWMHPGNILCNDLRSQWPRSHCFCVVTYLSRARVSRDQTGGLSSLLMTISPGWPGDCHCQWFHSGFARG